ncbi:hypothetical protein RVR_4754 [Actinacidiphila reveromycinica]|uniref:Uncharacterized protein n=1 Tax=Actinacidiphila reveromycinica TaxID=659352 RepID=A0A7U3UTF8_9ACTN|nr:hypothetical protein [Streptomyces sp. SN-593]BBA98537.1 hypothetical protein RVR_4754 [Streptomyces sp. SN-593]
MTEGLRPPPEGLLLIAARARQGCSGRDVAQRTALSAAILRKLGSSPRKSTLSESYWRSVAGGYQWVGRKKVPARPSARGVARYAHALGVTAEQLTTAGRADAAQLLRTIAAEVAKEEKERRDVDAARRASGNPARVEERWLMLEPLLRQAPVGLDDDERDDLRDRVDGLLTRSAQWQAPHAQDAAGKPAAAKTAKAAKTAGTAKSAKSGASKAKKAAAKATGATKAAKAARSDRKSKGPREG